MGAILSHFQHMGKGGRMDNVEEAKKMSADRFSRERELVIEVTNFACQKAPFQGLVM